MASSSFINESNEQKTIEIKLYIKELALDRGKTNDLNINIFCGYTTENNTKKVSDKVYLYEGQFINGCLIDEDLCLLSINIIEKTKNELGQICFRNMGNISFKLIELYKTNGINTRINFDKTPIFNHCVDDEIYLISELKDKRKRIIGEISGSLMISRFDNDKITSNDRKLDYNAIVMKNYINPWYDNLTKLAPKGPVTDEISDYHVPIFRLLSGSILPFSYSLLWKNRYFSDGFENDPNKCAKFVEIISNLVDASVAFHPEFGDQNNNYFYRKCNDFINNNSTDQMAYSCIDVIINILNIKTASEPYVSDELYLTGLKKKISVDQMSNPNDIYGCDCEDGAKYAYELKRLICNSNWPLILQTMNNSQIVKNIMNTIVPVLRMLCSFFSVMYCNNGICHVVLCLIDWNTTAKLCNIRSKIVNNQKILRILTDHKILFVETTAYSSPFQTKIPDEILEKERKKKFNMSNIVSSEIASPDMSSLEVYSVNPYFKNSPWVSTFYKYFTNMMTTELLDFYPNCLDFLPITDGTHYGFSLNDFVSRSEAVQLIPRIKPDLKDFNMMNEIILAQLPSYDIYPNDQIIIIDNSMFSSSFEDIFTEKMGQLFRKSDIIKSKYYRYDDSLINNMNYVRMNIYTIDLMKEIDNSRFLVNILSKIEDLLRKYPIFYCFRIIQQQIYSYSKQTIVVNVFFYYMNDEKIDLVGTKKKKTNEFTPKRYRQIGRK